MSDQAVEQKVYEIVARQFGINVEAVTSASSIFNLAKDSLEIVELVLALERELDVKIEDDDLEKLGKAGDITDYICQKLHCQRSNVKAQNGGG